MTPDESLDELLEDELEEPELNSTVDFKIRVDLGNGCFRRLPAPVEI